MPRALIFANGELNPPYPSPADIQAGDWLLAADGGSLHCLSLGILPHILIGDFDSLDAELLRQLEAAGVERVTYPAHKDETDLELALDYARGLGATDIIVYGALGGRWDMTLANLMLLAHPAFTSVKLRLVDGNQEVSLLRAGEGLELHGSQGDTISLIPLSATAEGVTTRELEYPLSSGTLNLGSPRGVSNTMLSESCSISLVLGLLAVVHIRHRT